MKHLTFLFVFTILNFALCIPIEEYNELVKIRTNYQLESKFPTEPYEFCLDNPYFICRGEILGQMTLTGNIEGTSIPPNLTVFSSLTAIKLLNIPMGDFLDSYIQIHQTEVSIQCENCGISVLPSLQYRLNISLLILINNPLNPETYEISTFPSAFTLVIINTDIQFQNNWVTFVNDLVSPKQFFIFKLMVDSDFSPNFITSTSVTFQIPSTLPIPIDLQNLLLPFYALVNNNVEVFSLSLTTNTYQFPYIGKIGNVVFNNINFVTTSTITLGYNTFLNTIVIQNSPNFNINGKIPFENFAPSVLALSLNNLSISEYPGLPLNIVDVNFSGNNFTSLPRFSAINSNILFLNLSNNKIQGTLSAEYCKFKVDLSNNQFTGQLPSCLLCYVNHQSTKILIKGNQFSNYNDNDTTYPPCNSVINLTSNFTKLTMDSIYQNYYGTFIDPPRDSNQFVTSPLIDKSYHKVMLHNQTIWISGTNLWLQNLEQLGYFNLTILSTTPVTFKIPFVPDKSIILYHISYVPVYNGYEFSMTGINLGNSTTTTIKLNNEFICFIYPTQGSSNSLSCLVNTFEIPEKTYTVNVTNGNHIGYISVRFRKSFPIISAIVPAGSEGGESIIYGYFGVNLTVLEITVNYNPCPIISAFSSNITFVVKPDEGLPRYLLILKVQGLTTKDYYIYRDNIKCPDCGQHGSCNNFGTCVCKDGYAGPLCNFLISNSSVIINENSTTISNDKTKFEISLLTIKEMSYNQSVIYDLPIKGKFKLTAKPNDNTWTYTFKPNGTETVISYTIYKVPQDMNITFAGVEMALKKDDIKISVNIKKWEFQSALHTLQLTMGTNIQSDSQCTTSINSYQNNIDTIDYFTIEQEGKVFYGKFIDQMLSDGKPTYSSTKVLSKTDSEVIVGISMPHCIDECILDPNMSVLINPSDGCSNNSSSKKWIIPTVVVLSVVVGIALISLLVYKLKRGGFIYLSSHGRLHMFGKSIQLKKINKNGV
ncbi:tenascin C [Tieghemostelium lacteum]|uniref:Tenascin C n=1 Tax=Tieghemostelium lacteum TaxID=361077 RepID=A0A152A2W3_TIELA|nr:tenascin C [Tieghemostelium lacteum]|eukprot:KYR00602.1 tenascin C [Tieghemostelium lacteum]